MAWLTQAHAHRIGQIILVAYTFTAAVAAQAMGSAPPTIGAEIEEAKKELAAAFKPLHLIPILIPEQQRPGDVYLFATWTLRSHRAECFSQLSDGPSTSSLLNVLAVSGLSASAALRISGAAAIQGDAKLKQVTTMRFFDEMSFVVSQGALAAAQLPSSNNPVCEQLRPIINTEIISVTSPKELQKNAPLLAIIGRVIYAKRRIFIGIESNADVKTEAESLSKMLGPAGGGLKIVGADVSASAALGFQKEQGVIIEDTNALPVAFSPAFLPDIILSAELGGVPTPTGVHWRETKDDAETAQLFNTWFDRQFSEVRK